MGGRERGFSAALPSDCSSLEFGERWELGKEIRGVSLFPLYFLSLVPQSQLTLPPLFWGGCSKGGEGLLALVGGSRGGGGRSAPPCLDAASKLPRQVCLLASSQSSG